MQIGRMFRDGAPDVAIVVFGTNDVQRESYALRAESRAYRRVRTRVRRSGGLARRFLPAPT